MSSDNQIGKIDIVPLRTAFPHEAHNFTVWLEQNIDALTDRIGLDLTVIEREKTVGSFNVDLLCEDSSGRPVIIENQLERTDHDHLGKLLTYMVNLDAKTVIWVALDSRPEHERVIDWLNESTGADMAFYLIKVEAIRIGDSPYAPLFSVISRPDEQTREIGEKKKEWAAQDHKRYDFWSQLLELSQAKGVQLFSNTSPNRYNWIGMGAGKSGITFNYSVGRNWANTELYIDHDRQSGELNKAIFDALYAQKEAIEADFGRELNWWRLDEKHACRITYVFDIGLDTPDRWPELHETMIDTMIRLDSALRYRLAQVDI